MRAAAGVSCEACFCLQRSPVSWPPVTSTLAPWEFSGSSRTDMGSEEAKPPDVPAEADRRGYRLDSMASFFVIAFIQAAAVGSHNTIDLHFLIKSINFQRIQAIRIFLWALSPAFRRCCDLLKDVVVQHHRYQHRWAAICLTPRG
jgi:hypothetical protein